MKWLFENSGGRKFLLAILAIVGMVVLTALGRIDSDLAVETIKWLAIGAMGAIAVEDGLAGLKAAARPPRLTEEKDDG